MDRGFTWRANYTKQPCTQCTAGNNDRARVLAQIAKCNERINFGKFKYRTFGEIAEQEKEYAHWCTQQSSTRWPQMREFQIFTKVRMEYLDYWNEQGG